MTHRVLPLAVALGLVSAAAAGCGVARGETAPSGAALYGSCESCHGATGTGDPSVGAPRIAGLPKWYVASQVERFQNGLRGKHFDDAEGLRMRAMARQMMTKAEVDAVSEFVAGLPAVVSPATLKVSNRAAAETLFAACGTCHGASGQGNETLSTPPIAGLDDWYLAGQVRKFQAGVRGTAKDDVLGPQMTAMSQAVPPEDVDNMAAYLHGLK